MSCAERDEALSLLVSDDLEPDEARTLHLHLAGCADCRARLEEYRADAQWLRQQRGTPPDVRVTTQLRARVADQITHKRPVPSWVAWLCRVFEATTRRGPQPLLAAMAACLLVVGAVGALTRPLDGRDGRYLGTVEDAGLATSRHAHRDPAKTEAPEADEDGDGVEPGSDDPARVEAEAEAETAAPNPGETAAVDGPGTTRIELRTGDPDVRIIWFAQADGQRRP
jgi:anti-sigma factor RsiW